MSKFEEQTLALAGIFQAAELVNQLAFKGSAEQADLERCIKTLFVTDPQTVIEIYGSLAELKTGLRTLALQMGDSRGSGMRSMEVSRYVLNLIHLAKRLLNNPAMLQQIADGLEAAERQAGHFGTTHENVIANLADIYSSTISTLAPRIMVKGDGAHLAVQDTANRIRALLLAGIRSAVLWHQKRGSRLQLLFRRKAFVNEAHRLLNQA